MIFFWFCNVNNFKSQQFNCLLKTLPSCFYEDILSYRFQKDREISLIGKLLLQKAIKFTKNENELLANFKKQTKNKPYIEGWYYFNISHSRNYVVLSFSKDHEIGVDIEYINRDIDHISLGSFFTKDEQIYLQKAMNPVRAFYNLWTKKEAVLKATGEGLTRNLNNFTCIDNFTLFREEVFHFYPIGLDIAYVCNIAAKKCNLLVKSKEILSFL